MHYCVCVCVQFSPAYPFGSVSPLFLLLEIMIRKVPRNKHKTCASLAHNAHAAILHINRMYAVDANNLV